ncbi:MAG: hypothetical protein E6Q97_04860 [Desulfurellales bacterium]|nr:MAG: hypothetical protein E6Q97_04860 [Desulfurellales bacterium]
MRKIPQEVFSAAVASRDPDTLIELLRPYVVQTRARKPTISYRRMSPEERRAYNRETKQRERTRKKALKSL